jgi:hypothetical protein
MASTPPRIRAPPSSPDSVPRKLRARRRSELGEAPHPSARMRLQFSPNQSQQIIHEDPVSPVCAASASFKSMACVVPSLPGGDVIGSGQTPDGQVHLALWTGAADKQLSVCLFPQLTSVFMDFEVKMPFGRPVVFAVQPEGGYRFGCHAISVDGRSNWVIYEFSTGGELLKVCNMPMSALTAAGLNVQTAQCHYFVDDGHMPAVLLFSVNSEQGDCDDCLLGLISTRWNAKATCYESKVIKFGPTVVPSAQLVERRLHPASPSTLSLASVWLLGACNGRRGRNEIYSLEQWRYVQSDFRLATVRRHLLSVRSSINGELLRQTLVSLPHLHRGCALDSMFVTDDGVVTGLFKNYQQDVPKCSQFTLSADWLTVMWREVQLDGNNAHQSTLLMQYPEVPRADLTLAMLTVGDDQAYLERLVHP